MEITILGSGVTVPTKRKPPGYLIQNNDDLILFDSGSGILNQIQKAGFDFTESSHLFYSHTHADHISDLALILQAIWVQSDHFGGNRKKELNIYGPKGFKESYQKIRDIISLPKESYSVNVNELSNSRKEIDGMRIISKPVIHVEGMNCLAFRVEKDGKSFVYSGDSVVCDNLIELCKDADLAILDCSFPKDYPAGVHLGVSGCCEVGKKSNVKKIVLSHLYPQCQGHDLVKECEFKGEVIVAEDLMRIEI